MADLDTNFKLPTSAQEVVDLQNRVFGLHTSWGTDDAYLTDLIHRLEKLHTILKAQEQEFYRMLAVNSIEELQHKLEVLNDSNFRGLLNYDTKEFEQLMQIMTLDLTQNLRIYFDNIADQKDFVRILQYNLQEGVENPTFRAIQRMTHGQIINQGQFTEFLQNIEKSIDGQINITIDLSKRKNQVTFRTTENFQNNELSNRWLKRLKDDFHVIIENVGGAGSNRLRNWCKSHMPSELQPYFNDQFRHLTERYDLNITNSNSIKGFLGELYANISLAYLLGKSASVTATGKVRNKLMPNSPEVPIDALAYGKGTDISDPSQIMKLCGFQVKNYNIKDNILSLGGKNPNSSKDWMRMDNFLKIRLRAEEDVNNLLEQFFASYQYNQLVLDPGKVDTAAQYQHVVDRFTNSVDRLTSIFAGYIPNIVNIQAVIQSDKVFTTAQEYYNTFFIVRDKYIPSSAIIEVLIETLQHIEDLETRTTSILKIQYHNTKKGHYGIGQKEAERLGIWNKDSTTQPSIASLLSQVRIYYQVNFDLETILNKADAHIQKLNSGLH